MPSEAAPPVTGYYLELLTRVHRELRPRTYLEIGVHTGDSLTLVQPETLAIGIDPVASIRRPINRSAQLFFKTSDEFFASNNVKDLLGNRPVDLAFIDGMHLFEYALRDFRNVEASCGPDSVVLMHDCYPKSAAHASRHRQQREWTGDTWKLVLCLMEYRPDLSVHTITVGASGMSIIRGMNPNLVDNPLHTKYDEIVNKYIQLDFTEIEHRKSLALNAIPYDWDRISSIMPQGPLVTTPVAPTKRARRVSIPIVLHQAKRYAKLLLSKEARRNSVSSVS